MWQLPVKAKDLVLWVLVDDDDVARLEGHKLSLGSHGYVQFWQDGTCVLLHRWLTGAQRGDGRLVDHKNRIKLDCQKSNLEFVTPGESSANVSGHSACGYRGVTRNHAKWKAQAKRGGKQIYLVHMTRPKRLRRSLTTGGWRTCQVTAKPLS